MRISRRHVMLVLAVLSLSLPVAAQSTARSPRTAVITFFSRLKTGQYDVLYDQLPSQIQQQASREQTVRSLKRLGAFIVMERMEVGRLQQRGNFAVIDTIIYGRLSRPMKLQGEEIVEGRMTIQQYLIKEGKEWRVITADDRTRAFFLRQNPEFSRGFTLASPQFAYKRGSIWQPLLGRATDETGSHGSR